MKRTKYKTMTDALRAAIIESELPYKTLERETGVKRQSLMKFAEERQSLRLESADKLAEFFGFEVVKRKAN